MRTAPPRCSLARSRPAKVRSRCSARSRPRRSASPPTTCMSCRPIPTRPRWIPARSPAARPMSPAMPSGSPPKPPRRSCSRRRRPCLASRRSQLEAKDRKIQVKGYPQRSVAIGEVSHRSQIVLGQPPIGSASWNPPTVPLGSGQRPGQAVQHLRLRGADRRGGGRRRDRRGRGAAHLRRARLRHADQPDAGRGPDRGRHRHGHRLCAAGGDAVRRRRPADQPESHQLHHADRARHAGDRGRHRRQLRSDRAVRRQGRRRAEPGADRGRDLQRHPRRGRRAHHVAAGDRRKGACRDQGQARRGRRQIPT